MSGKEHKVETNWRESDASALEARAEALNHWIDHTEDIVEMLDKDEELRMKALALEGLVRSRRNDFISTAEKLRAEIRSR